MPILTGPTLSGNAVTPSRFVALNDEPTTWQNSLREQASQSPNGDALNPQRDLGELGLQKLKEKTQMESEEVAK